MADNLRTRVMTTECPVLNEKGKGGEVVLRIENVDLRESVSGVICPQYNSSTHQEVSCRINPGKPCVYSTGFNYVRS